MVNLSTVSVSSVLVVLKLCLFHSRQHSRVHFTTFFFIFAGRYDWFIMFLFCFLVNHLFRRFLYKHHLSLIFSLKPYINTNSVWMFILGKVCSIQNLSFFSQVLLIFCYFTKSPGSVSFTWTPLVNPRERKLGWVDHILPQIAHIIAILGFDNGHLWGITKS